MNALLTGFNGFLGSYVLAELEKLYQVTTMGLGQGHIPIDLTVLQPKTDQQFDKVVHLAGLAHFHPSTPEEEQRFFDVNLTGTKNLFNGLSGNLKPGTSVVFISTVAVYGLDEAFNVSEDWPLLGNTPYAKSKIEAEAWLTTFCEKNQLKLTILRPPLVIGKDPLGNLMALIDGIKKRKYLSIAGGKARKSMVLASDIARLIADPEIPEGIFNLTDGKHPSFKELENRIAEHLGQSSPPSIPLFAAKILGWVGDVLGGRFPVNSDKITKITSDLTFSDDHLREQYSWKPTPVLEDTSWLPES
jgi:nucleoside-diphosphate-sugar epimerase